MKQQRILLSRIDVITDGWDDFIFDTDPQYVDRLIESFKRVGQIYPLLLLKYMDWMFLIAGYARYLAMRELEVDEARARLFQENEISKEDCLWLSLESKCDRPFSPTAQRRALDRFHKLANYSEERLANEVAPAMGLDLKVDEVREMLIKDE